MDILINKTRCNPFFFLPALKIGRAITSADCPDGVSSPPDIEIQADGRLTTPADKFLGDTNGTGIWGWESVLRAYATVQDGNGRDYSAKIDK